MRRFIMDLADFAWKGTKFFVIYTIYSTKERFYRMKQQLNTEFDWQITLKKALLSALLVFIAGLLAWMEQEPMLLAIVPVVEAIRNVIKHRWHWD